MALAGAFEARQKNGKVYYRSSVTYRNKHISLGSYDTEEMAHAAYKVAKDIISNEDITIDAYRTDTPLDFDKFVTLINFRDNKVYIKNPIYLEKTYFSYYLTPSIIFKFDIDDLFYFASHKISRRNGHLWVADYGMQVNLNIEIINRYTGVYAVKRSVYTKYSARILVNGLYTIGTYDTDVEAAIAYNKAADIIRKARPEKNFRMNYIESMSAKEYALMYIKVPISDRIFRDFT